MADDARSRIVLASQYGPQQFAGVVVAGGRPPKPQPEAPLADRAKMTIFAAIAAVEALIRLEVDASACATVADETPSQWLKRFHAAMVEVERLMQFEDVRIALSLANPHPITWVWPDEHAASWTEWLLGATHVRFIEVFEKVDLHLGLILSRLRLFAYIEPADLDRPRWPALAAELRRLPKIDWPWLVVQLQKESERVGASLAADVNNPPLTVDGDFSQIPAVVNPFRYVTPSLGQDPAATRETDLKIVDANGSALGTTEVRPASPPKCCVEKTNKPRYYSVFGKEKGPLTRPRTDVIDSLLKRFPDTYTKDQLAQKSRRGSAVQILKTLANADSDWERAIKTAGVTCGGYGLNLFTE